MVFCLYYLNIFYEPERCEGLFLMSRTSEAGEEVLSRIQA